MSDLLIAPSVLSADFGRLAEEVRAVDPGFGGQIFLPEMLPKIAALRALCPGVGLHQRIAVDGGQDSHSVRSVVEAGTDVIVAGTTRTSDYAKAITDIRSHAA